MTPADIINSGQNNFYSVKNENNFLSSLGSNFGKLCNYEKVACFALSAFFGYNIARSIVVFFPLVPLGLVACAHITVYISMAFVLGNILSGIAERERANFRAEHPLY